MAQYGKQDDKLRGEMFGSVMDIETKVVASGNSFTFGDPVCVDQGDEDSAYEPDSTDATLVFLGVAPISHRSYTDSEDTYVAYQDMNVLTKGSIVVAAASGLTTVAQQPAYLVDDTTSADYKKFTTSNSGTLPTGAYFRSNVSDGLVRLELRGGTMAS